MKFTDGALISTFILGAKAAWDNAKGVPPLACFGAVPIVDNKAFDVVYSDLSGVTYNADNNHLYFINNGDCKVYETEASSPYTLIKEYGVSSVSDPVTGPTEDLEGIWWVSGNTFAVTDENPASIFTGELDATTGVMGTGFTTVVNGIAGVDGAEAAKSNLGFEGVAKITQGGADYWVTAQEGQPARLWAFPADSPADGKAIEFP